MDTVPLTQNVFTTLTHSRAALERAGDLGDGMAVARWHNQDDATNYRGPGHHTVSLYLAGGYQTWRRDKPGVHGAPGRLCVLPDEHESEWVIQGDLQFMHLYFSPAQFSAAIITLLDREPRSVQLHDLTYAEDPVLAALCGQIARQNWQDSGSRLAANELAHAVVGHLVRVHSGRRFYLAKGGLAPHLRRRLIDYINSHLDAGLTLGELASQVALSEFHFARAFRDSFGMPPHAWLTARRLDRARQLLRHGDQPLVDVAAACGFADASHFSNRFRAALGASPSQYRAALSK
ncbi:helix-turn-helix domain-containing protein [Silvimonas amylolytica]|uniref:AraC family transcriptional regulator n=1 Tax=Silvimonas amylolytica TaxID=449663 RepID=A0ABQ2PMU8_9NEIS|nr:AraC family transcriptional regulator [Silvimonas amylolytica]GGP26648.1 AraC family transcriptional regulator [Silvimonas amylolytica]